MWNYVLHPCKAKSTWQLASIFSAEDTHFERNGVHNAYTFLPLCSLLNGNCNVYFLYQYFQRTLHTDRIEKHCKSVLWSAQEHAFILRMNHHITCPCYKITSVTIKSLFFLRIFFWGLKSLRPRETALHINTLILLYFPCLWRISLGREWTDTMPVL